MGQFGSYHLRQSQGCKTSQEGEDGSEEATKAKGMNYLT